jgi:hypothetical protein
LAFARVLVTKGVKTAAGLCPLIGAAIDIRTAATFSAAIRR